MIQWLHEFIWGPGMLALFLFVGILYTVKLRGFPIWGITRWWSATVGSLFRRGGDGHSGNLQEERQSEISVFQSACTALAATIGTGNIAGVATALLAGGPGAVFWMWVSAALGMATAYAETELGIRYRRRDGEGGWISGAMVYLDDGLKCRWLAVIYACLCLAASFGMGSMVQANAISETFEYAFSMPPLLIGAILTVFAGKIIVGGSKAIAATAEKMVPVSAAIYIIASVAVIAIFHDRVPVVFQMIFQDAFQIDSAAGGILGFATSECVRFGVARGVFSNEAGLGSMAALNGGADQPEPAVQGQWAIFEVFFDTLVCCTLTAIVILCAVGDELAIFYDNGAALTSLCFTRALGYFGGYIVSICVALFAFATIIAWYYMGKQAVLYLGETAGINVAPLYLCGYLACVFLGSLGPMEAVWEISDIFNGMMAIPNLLALILLLPQVQRPGEKMMKSKTPKAPKALKAPKAPKAPKASEAPKALKAPKVPGVAKYFPLKCESE